MFWNTSAVLLIALFSCGRRVVSTDVDAVEERMDKYAVLLKETIQHQIDESARYISNIEKRCKQEEDLLFLDIGFRIFVKAYPFLKDVWELNINPLAKNLTAETSFTAHMSSLSPEMSRGAGNSGPYTRWLNKVQRTTQTFFRDLLMGQPRTHEEL